MPSEETTANRPIEYISNAAQLADWVEHLQGAKWIAVDTESDSFHHYRERVCLIQMTALDVDAIIDPLAININDLSMLGPVLREATRVKIFHDAGYDLACLLRDFGFEVRGLFDTMLASRLLGKRKFGLASILSERFDFQADKRYQRSDWTRRPLSDGQLHYARNDTRFLPELACTLESELSACDRLEWAKEDFVELPEQIASAGVRSTSFNPDGFWRIRGIRGLQPDELGRVKSLYAARDALAEEYDRPPFKVFSDATILDLSTSPPNGTIEPRSGLGKAGIHRFGKAILAALGEASPVTERPPKGAGKRRRPSRSFRDDRVRELYESLRKVRKELAKGLDIEPEVLMSNATLAHLADRPPASQDELVTRPGIEGWRAPIVSRRLFATLQVGSKQ